MKELERQSEILEFDFHSGGSKWPKQERFPINNPDNSDNVSKVILGIDLTKSKDFLLVTGFTSLSQLVEVFGTEKYDHIKSVRILLGNDPIFKKRKKYPFGFVPLELKEYWLEKGLSLRLGASVMRIIQKLENGAISIKFKKKSHAKIYIGEKFATIGSSNFSRMGLETQQEANIRVSGKKDYHDLKLIAENYYYDGLDYKDELIDLLKQLLADVTWEEALARAIAEVLEGGWFVQNNVFFDELSKNTFWGTQYQGLIEAINILMDKGNVLIADPTGSGKTRMCAAIMISYVYWLWEMGEKRMSNLLLFTPPMVKSNWQDELRSLEYLNYTLRSTGMLSNTTDSNLTDILKDLAISKILVIDEAHNLLNPSSNRSRNLARNKADFKILITATPINKKLEDLIRMIELLDVDNLTDNDFILYKDIKENKFLTADKDDREKLKNFIDPFLVRRTKSELNKIIDKNPEEYRNRNGNQCRFPNVKNLPYKTRETDRDKKLVQRISDEALKLKGINYLMRFTPPEYLIKDDEHKERYIRQRLMGARNLSIYNIRAALRSSKAALQEYLLGTDYVKAKYEVESNKNPAGNLKLTIEGLRKKLPDIQFESEHFPHWLINEPEFILACDEELKVYDTLISLTEELSIKRETGKIDRIRRALLKHNIIVAFDSKLITLDFLEKELRQRYPHIKTYVATGSNKGDIEKVLKVCRLGSKAKNVVVFCSDVMSEGVNMQNASSLILLDLPSVVRLVEQRIGRIDRMDSDHKQIEVLWPDDSEEFSLKGDKRLIQTSAFVDSTIGGNFDIPYELRHKHFENVNGGLKALQNELEEQKGDKGWEGNKNFFSPIQKLKEEFIKDELYDQLKEVKAQIKTRVSFRQSKEDWCFICTRGTEKESPKWLLLKIGQKVTVGFSEVADELFKLLQTNETRLTWNQDVLDQFLKEFRGQEKLLLPEKRRRALVVGEELLTLKYSEPKNRNLQQLIGKNLALMRPKIKGEIADLYSLSEMWLTILEPVLIEEREKKSNRRKALNLNSLLESHKKVKIDKEKLQWILDECAMTEDIDHRIAACIIGIKTLDEE